MKKLINKAEDVVKEELEGMAAAHSDLIRVDVEQQLTCIVGHLQIIEGDHRELAQLLAHQRQGGLRSAAVGGGGAAEP